MRRIRTALVGCGKVGGIHAEVLASLPESEFVAACDASEDRARAFAGRYGVAPYADVGAMLDGSSVEALVVATPHPLHAAPTIVAARRGVHVLIEKPMAASLADCDAMLEAAEAGGSTLGVVSQRRFCEPVLRLKAAIDAGKIGAPALGTVAMFNWRDEAYYRSDPWRGQWASEGGGVLVNQAPHLLDLLQWFMGEIDSIDGAWANLNHPTIEVEDTAVATVRFRGGGLGSIVVSLSQRPGLYSKVHVHGSSGASVGVETDRGATFVAGVSAVAEPPLNDVWTIPGEEALLDGFRGDDRAAFGRIDPATHYHALQVGDFLRAVRDGRPPLVTGRDGRTVVAMFSAIYESQKLRRSVPFPA